MFLAFASSVFRRRLVNKVISFRFVSYFSLIDLGLESVQGPFIMGSFIF